MTPRPMLRGVTIAIALAGVVDPVFTLTRPMPKPLTIAVLAYGGLPVAARLEGALSREYSVTVSEHDATADAAACPASGDCVLLSEGRRPSHMTAGATVVGAVRLNPGSAPGVRIRRVTAPRVVNPGASSTLDVELPGGAANVEVFDADVLVGRVEKPTSPTVTVQWTPVAEGLRELRVRADDDEVPVGVDVRPFRSRVLIYEPRPSWTGTFVRRALEHDPRFDVRASAVLGRALSVSTPAPLRLDAQTLAEAAVVVVSAPDLLTASDVARLDRFARLRGGSVILLPDRMLAGPVRALVPAGVDERRETTPRAIGALKASEFLAFEDADVATTVLAAAGDVPVVISRARGNGRVIVSGALDAWRFREEGDGFARFWTSVVADAADAAGPPLSVTVDTMLAYPGEWVGVVVEHRAMGEIDDAGIESTLSCEGQPLAPIRLWPDGAPNRFRGSLRPSRPGPCRIDATLATSKRDVEAGREGGPATPKRPREGGSARFLVSRTAPRPGPDDQELAGAVSAHGGIVVSEQDVALLVTRLRASASPDRVSRQTRPMRSPWWIVPFAACVSGEWCLRRRQGLR